MPGSSSLKPSFNGLSLATGEEGHGASTIMSSGLFRCRSQSRATAIGERRVGEFSITVLVSHAYALSAIPRKSKGINRISSFDVRRYARRPAR
ncbi:hypothetical protein HYPDE_31188 [Hyphomicrobium denitrificans 1NES1]|uniref:Uncharacterized protein n=1 Tax=Hyphomicrobium denitrificans 1NES1 TaxID=670307 RepID=N0B6R5_9HYPH|nr:hypothetical protein HYPDE_31188 [Hyphomicrobium denitrificans 1NES1]